MIICIVVFFILIIWYTYYATKVGMIDDAVNFIKYEILKMKRGK